MNGLQDTLQLNSSTWDLMVDGVGNIALAQGSAAVAQDVGTAVATYLGEVWYDTSIGVPYLSDVLGQAPNLGVLASYYNQQALRVLNVTAARTTFGSLTSSRKLEGQVEVIDTYGQTLNVTF